MKTNLHSSILLLIFILSFSKSQAQNPVNRHIFFNFPEFAPGASHAIALSKLGLKKNNYSVLIKARLPGDSIFYTIPGHFPMGESFGFRLKVGHEKTQTDTLFLINREGQQSVRLEEVMVYFFHQNDRLIPRKPDRDFTSTVLNDYYDPHTRRGAVLSAGKGEIFKYSTTIFSHPVISSLKKY